MQEGGGAKQQIVEKLKNSTNILVTVSNNPSVDALSAALGLTLMLNKMDKHGTAVFSGTVPPAIQFLEPEKTFEGTTDSLRDFIIALDKEKADRLRYKVDGDMVRIYITPYRTNISEKDLEFSQGDFNVEAIVALGVEKREELDNAIAQHGRILHDATVMTINTKQGSSKLGSVDWQDSEASSYCEMLMSLSEALQTGLLDEQISNALLTGIVAATDRFSNEHTKPRVMTMAAQLMAAGANQQLIATKLQDSHIINSPAAPKPEEKKQNTDGSTSLKEGASTKLNKEEVKQEDAEAQKPKKKSGNGEMHIDHTPGKPENTPPEPHIDSSTAGLTPEEIADKNQNDAVNAAEGALADALPSAKVPTTQSPTLADIERELKKEGQAPQTPPPSESNTAPKSDTSESKKAFTDQPPSWMGHRVEPPTMGGTLNATGEEALQNKLKAEEEGRKHAAILNHSERPVNEGQLPPAPAVQAPAELPQVSPPPPNTPVALPPPPSTPPPPVAPAPSPEPANSGSDDVHAARDAVNAVLNNAPSESPMPDYEATPITSTSPYASAYSPPSQAAPAPPEAAPTPSMPTPPPLPDMNNLPPLPPSPTPPPAPPLGNEPVGTNGDASMGTNTSSGAGGLPPTPNSHPDPFGPPPLDQNSGNAPNDPQPGSNNPGQFKIPGQ